MSLILLMIDVYVFTSIYLLLCSLVSSIVLFTLNLVKNENYFLFPFSAGIVLIFLFIYSFFINPELLKDLWEYLFTGLILISNLGIQQLLKNRKNILGNITKYSFWISGLLMIYILITKENTPVFYTIEYIILAIASVCLTVSVLIPENHSTNVPKE